MSTATPTANLRSHIIKKGDRLTVATLYKDLCDKQKLRPQELVDQAKDPRHVLHKYFEWDDAKCGEKFRLQQAGDLIRDIKIIVQTAPAREVKINLVTSVRPDPDTVERRPQYTMTTDLARSENAPQLNRVLVQLMAELRAIRNKYKMFENLAALSPLWIDIDNLLNSNLADVQAAESPAKIPKKATKPAKKTAKVSKKPLRK